MNNGEKIVAVEGMGPDAEVTTNAAGGQQSQAPNAFHLVDPEVALDLIDIMGKGMPILENVEQEKAMNAFKLCLDYMLHYEPVILIKAMELIEPNMFKVLETVAGRLMYGITKGNNGKGYKTNNWRLIPREEHLNHAMNHMFAIAMGDTQDDHRSAAICRLHMASATKESRGFKYQEYIDIDSLPEEVSVVDKINNIKSRATVQHVSNHNQRSSRVGTEKVTMLDIITDEQEEYLPESKLSPAGILHYISTATDNPKKLADARRCVEKGMTLEETLIACDMELVNSTPGTITEFKQ